TEEQLRQMMQALVIERFKLTFHRETKEASVYALVVGKNGHKLEEAKADDPGPQLQLRMRREVTAKKADIGKLAGILSMALDRVVIDQTGLKGNYNFELKWTPDESQPRGLDSPDAAASDPSGPSLFTAVQEQLGLKLEAKKAPVDLFTIDRAEKASEN